MKIAVLITIVSIVGIVSGLLAWISTQPGQHENAIASLIGMIAPTLAALFSLLKSSEAADAGNAAIVVATKAKEVSEANGERQIEQNRVVNGHLAALIEATGRAREAEGRQAGIEAERARIREEGA